ncbi:MAG: PEP-CTERM sorting domain-containing protein [Verrucomicrobia bacterium]|nr:PEP-CTERM sorting domain-containing protein [Verrucomicrobiota bacterium]
MLAATAMAAQAALVVDLDSQIGSSVLLANGNEVTSWVNQGTGGSAYNALGLIGKVLYPSASTSPTALSGLDMGSTRNALRLAPAGASQNALLNFSSNGKDGFTVFVAFKADSILLDPVRNTVLVNHGNAATANSFGLRYDQTGTMNMFMGGVLYNKGGSDLKVEVGDTIVYGVRYTAATGAFEFWDSKNDSILAGTSVANGNFSSTQPLYLGGSGNDQQWMEGMIGEVLFYDNVLTEQEFSDAQAALVNTWVVPEPSAISLAGLAGLGLFLRRRHSK